MTEIENYQHTREIFSPLLTPRARFNVFVRQYISIAICRYIYLFTTKKCCRNLEEEQFPPTKKIAPVFKGMEIVVGIFSTVTAICFRVRQPYTGISELNNEVDLRPVQDHLRQILGINSSTGLIYRVEQKIVLQSPKAKLWFSKSSEASEFHRRSIIFLFPVKPTSLDSAVSPFACGQSHSAFPLLRQFCHRNAARKDSCVHFK